MVELVDQHPAVRMLGGKVHLLGQADEDAVDRDVVWQLNVIALVAGGVPDLNVDVAHRKSHFPNGREARPASIPVETCDRRYPYTVLERQKGWVPRARERRCDRRDQRASD